MCFSLSWCVELAGSGVKQPTEHSEWSTLFDDVLDTTTGLPLMGPPVTPLSPVGTGLPVGMSNMDGWVLEETKKLEAQQRIQQRKLLDLKQVCVCMCVVPIMYMCRKLGQSSRYM